MLILYYVELRFLLSVFFFSDMKRRNDENIANRRTQELLVHRMAVLRKNQITFISGLAKG